MDGYSDHQDQFGTSGSDGAIGADEGPCAIGTDERRMHVRAYNYWVSLLNGRDFPSIEDLEGAAIDDFSAHSVLLDFTGTLDNPTTPFVGDAVRAEIGVDSIERVSDIPGRSLLSRLTDHHFQIIATRAPVGFEAEFVNQRGHEICYRGILMPFSSNGHDIDFVYGVINWKDNGPSTHAATPIRAILPPIVAEREDEQQLIDKLLAEERAHEALAAERKKSMTLMRDPDETAIPTDSDPDPAPGFSAPPVEEAIVKEDEEEAFVSVDTEPAGQADGPPVPHLSWEDGPLADAAIMHGDDDRLEAQPATLEADAGLADRLCAARASADICKAADGRSRAALYRALAMAFDFAVAARRVPGEYAEILDDAGVKGQARAPMTPVVKLVFGVDYDKARLTEFAAALSYAERCQVDFGQFESFLSRQDGGLKAMVAAERKARRPEGKPEDHSEKARVKLRQCQPIELAEIGADEEFVLVLSRRRIGGGVGYEPIALVDDDKMTERAIRRAGR